MLRDLAIEVVETESKNIFHFHIFVFTKKCHRFSWGKQLLFYATTVKPRTLR